ncbi:MAG TPA: ATP-binding protein [Mesotoga infera]|nr:sensor histidine kinase [Mesotoga sp.]HNR78931.1 ATP-binding protein [Mesotoga infera]HPD37525.1 ATP-binding protein [Mesotoga infera]HRV00926.1 ATP-binding protein [Mesotoga sp.]
MGLRTLCDHIVDIAQNAVESGTGKAWLDIEEHTDRFFRFTVRDVGRGIPEEFQESVLDPFYTQKNKKVKFGLGLPMLKFAALSTGGEFELKSSAGKGTTVSALFVLSHVDCQPIGDVAMALFSIITMKGEIDWYIQRSLDDDGYAVESSQFREALGNNCFTTPVKMKMILDLLQEAENSLGGYSDVR